MSKLISAKRFKKSIAATLIVSLLLNPIAFATHHLIELDLKDSNVPHRLHTIMPLSKVRDISYLELNVDEQSVIVYKQDEVVDYDMEDTPQLQAINIAQEDVCHLPWHLGHKGLEIFLSQHTAWLTPLDKNTYKIEFKGRLLGGVLEATVTQFTVDCGGRSDYAPGTYGYSYCSTTGSDGGGYGNSVINTTGRSYGKNSDGGSDSSGNNGNRTNDHYQPTYVDKRTRSYNEGSALTPYLRRLKQIHGNLDYRWQDARTLGYAVGRDLRGLNPAWVGDFLKDHINDTILSQLENEYPEIMRSSRRAYNQGSALTPYLPQLKAIHGALGPNWTDAYTLGRVVGRDLQGLNPGWVGDFLIPYIGEDLISRLENEYPEIMRSSRRAYNQGSALTPYLPQLKAIHGALGPNWTDAYTLGRVVGRDLQGLNPGWVGDLLIPYIGEDLISRLENEYPEIMRSSRRAYNQGSALTPYLPQLKAIHGALGPNWIDAYTLGRVVGRDLQGLNPGWVGDLLIPYIGEDLISRLENEYPEIMRSSRRAYNQGSALTPYLPRLKAIHGALGPNWIDAYTLGRVVGRDLQGLNPGWVGDLLATYIEEDLLSRLENEYPEIMRSSRRAYNQGSALTPYLPQLKQIHGGLGPNWIDAHTLGRVVGRDLQGLNQAGVGDFLATYIAEDLISRLENEHPEIMRSSRRAYNQGSALTPYLPQLKQIHGGLGPNWIDAHTLGRVVGRDLQGLNQAGVGDFLATYIAEDLISRLENEHPEIMRSSRRAYNQGSALTPYLPQLKQIHGALGPNWTDVYTLGRVVGRDLQGLNQGDVGDFLANYIAEDLLSRLENEHPEIARSSEKLAALNRAMDIVESMKREGLVSGELPDIQASLATYTIPQLSAYADQHREIYKTCKIRNTLDLLEVMKEKGLVSDDLSACHASLTTYDISQLNDYISNHCENYATSLIKSWHNKAHIRGLYSTETESEIVQVNWVKVLGLLKDGVRLGGTAIKQGIKTGKEYFRQNAVKRFIEKDWKKDLDIPQRWNKMDVKRQDGVKYRLPGENPRDYHEIRVMKGRPDSDFLGQRVDYIKLNKKGQFYDINGNIVSGGSQEAHIPLKGNEKVIENLIKQIWK